VFSATILRGASRRCRGAAGPFADETNWRSVIYNALAVPIAIAGLVTPADRGSSHVGSAILVP